MKYGLAVLGGLLLMPLAAAAAADRDGGEGIIIDDGGIRMPGITIADGKIIIDDAGNGGVSIMNGGARGGSGGSSYSYSSSSVSVINGEVYIDGEKVPRDVTRYTSKSGTVYKIDRSGGGVSVSTE